MIARAVGRPLGELLLAARRRCLGRGGVVGAGRMPQMHCVNLGDTEAELLLLLLGWMLRAAFLLALAISAALRLRHLVRLFWNQTC